MKPAITPYDFKRTLVEMNVFPHDKEYRIKGFKINYTTFYDETYFVTISGKIPLILAKELLNTDAKHQIFLKLDDKHSIDIVKQAKLDVKADIRRSNDFKITDEKALEIVNSISEEDLFITSITINSIDGLKFVIETLRKLPYINEWAIGNY